MVFLYSNPLVRRTVVHGLDENPSKTQTSLWSHDLTQIAFHILTSNVEPGDAVSNDAMGMRNALRGVGFAATLYGEHISPSLANDVVPVSEYARRSCRKRRDLLIYHHSHYWELGEKLYDRTKNRKIIKYHNITPPHFFTGYSALFEDYANRGRKQTSRLVANGTELHLGDSLFNVEELIDAGADPKRTQTLPPFHHADELGKTEASIPELQSYLDGRINIVFVGRFVPNKGHLNLLRTFAFFRKHMEPNSRLIMVGKLDPEFAKYGEEIQSSISDLGLNGSVVTVSSASPGQLRSAYLAAHIFLCLSEHEGFCVPLVEAMYHKIPIVGLRRAAVPETLGPSALIADNADTVMLGEMMNYCLQENLSRRWLTHVLYQRYLEHFSNQTIRNRFLAPICNLVC
jgi:glycosyltransferase involved in cell wall biosynthesis